MPHEKCFERSDKKSIPHFLNDKLAHILIWQFTQNFWPANVWKVGLDWKVEIKVFKKCIFSVPPFLTCSKLITHPRNRLKCRFKYSKIQIIFQPKVFRVAVHFLQLILLLKNWNLVTVGIWTPNAQILNSFEIWSCLQSRFWMVKVTWVVKTFKVLTQRSFLWLFAHLFWILSYVLKTRPL